MKLFIPHSSLRIRNGFTLLEVLLVVAIIAILTGIVIVALNPAKQLGDTRNSERRVDVNTVLNAVYQYSIDNDGNFPGGIDSVVASSQVLGTSGLGCDTTCTAVTTITACLDLTSALVSTYVVGIPNDPKTGTASNTDYYLNKGADGRITVGACDPEQGEIISVTR